MENKQIELKISANLLQAVVNYLAKRPYEEVFTMLRELLELKKCEDCDVKKESKS